VLQPSAQLAHLEMQLVQPRKDQQAQQLVSNDGIQIHHQWSFITELLGLVFGLLVMFWSIWSSLVVVVLDMTLVVVVALAV
jgi:hypothetical protein